MVLEILLSAVIIIALLLFVGVPFASVLSLVTAIVMILLFVTIIGFILFFLIMDLSLLFSKKVKGIFKYVDDTGRFDKAVYAVNQQEYTCMFPAETLGRNRIYKENTEYTLLIPRLGKGMSVLDSHSLMIVAIGSVFSIGFAFLLPFAISFFSVLFPS
ncbi:MAG: hypothetical protein MJ071_02950 [Oscillospiraceae bacterium]|nr:hypothetical protein [Oscillospiraceae bacterium]